LAISTVQEKAQSRDWSSSIKLCVPYREIFPDPTMTIFIAFLRAVNVGGNGKLPMSELKRLCEEEGFAAVRAYIASGNVVFKTAKSAATVKQALEARLSDFAAYPVQVLVRSAEELAAVVVANPFPDAAPNRTVAIFLDHAPPADTLQNVKGQKNEEIRLGTREIYVHYGDGMGDSKLNIAAARDGTARNINTITKMVALAAQA
jgi:uncharacterized protein (DUF1697 family)